MTKTGLELFIRSIPKKIEGKKLGILCHAASVTRSYIHILDAIAQTGCRIGAIFGPQHGLFGQTQDNMIEWEGGFLHPEYKAPVYSLYGKSRKPGREMLRNLEAFVIDLQDVGARPYTYIWTAKLCMEACAELGIPVWVLDRPNPIGAVACDGPLLRNEYFSFVGGAQIPLCHRMTFGEMALFIKNTCIPSVELHMVWMKDWWRDSLFSETGLPWVLPSPNMPSVNTAVVYPGMVLFEATNLSEGRGTTVPFEILGAPFINTQAVIRNLRSRQMPGCVFREHNFIPTFNKWQGQYCYGMQIHVTNPRRYKPVFTAASIIEAVLQTSAKGALTFKSPPYEYEYEKMPFDILAGDAKLREALVNGTSLKQEQQHWNEDIQMFRKSFRELSHYPEKRE